MEREVLRLVLWNPLGDPRARERHCSTEESVVALSPIQAPQGIPAKPTRPVPRPEKMPVVALPPIHAPQIPAPPAPRLHD